MLKDSKCIFALIVIWYASSTIFSLNLQKFFQLIQINENVHIYSIVCLTVFIQNLSCYLGTFLFSIMAYIQTQRFDHLSSILPLGRHFLLAACVHLFGSLLMNYMLILSNIPCVYTIRAVEPLLASLFIYFRNHNNTHSVDFTAQKWIGTILMLSGVSLATWPSIQCSIFSNIIALGLWTNMLMIIRNHCIQTIHKENEEISIQLILHGLSTLLSLIFILANSDSSYFIFRRYRSLLCLIGLCNLIYNSTSIFVCSRIQLVSHSLLTMIKRPILIFASMIYFKSEINSLMISGNIIMFIGMLFYKSLAISGRKFYALIVLLLTISSLLISLIRPKQFVLTTTVKDLPVFYYKDNNSTENFGDVLSHVLVQLIVGRKLPAVIDTQPELFCRETKLLAIGSVFDFACENDVIWGSGILAPDYFPLYPNKTLVHTLDIRAVRGPRTRNILQKKFHLTIPEVYGDPALLLQLYLPSYRKVKKPTISTLLILHYIDITKHNFTLRLDSVVTVHTYLPWQDLLSLILQSKFVISISLHGIIVSEAFGVPARLLKSPLLDLFKFHDYYEGTNRTLRYARTLHQAIAMGGEQLPEIDLVKLLNAFPFDKFQ